MFYNNRRYWIILFSKFQLTVVASNHIYHLSPILALSDGLRNKRKHFMIIFLKSYLVLLDLKSLGAQNMTFSLLNKKNPENVPPQMCLFSTRYWVSFCIWPIFGMVFALFILYIVICLPVMLFGCKFYMFPSSDICKTSWANQSWSHMKISIEKSIVQDLRGPISLRAQCIRLSIQ